MTLKTGSYVGAAGEHFREAGRRGARRGGEAGQAGLNTNRILCPGDKGPPYLPRHRRNVA